MTPEQAYIAHNEALLHFACRLTRNLDRAEDLAQDTWRNAIARWGQFGGRSDLRTWLMAIARNSFVDECRSPRGRTLHVPIEDVRLSVAAKFDYSAEQESIALRLLKQIRLSDRSLVTEWANGSITGPVSSKKKTQLCRALQRLRSQVANMAIACVFACGLSADPLPPPDLLLIQGHIYYTIGTVGESAYYADEFTGITVQSYTLPGGSEGGPAYSPWSYAGWYSPVVTPPTFTPEPQNEPTPTPEPGAGALLIISGLWLLAVALWVRSRK